MKDSIGLIIGMFLIAIIIISAILSDKLEKAIGTNMNNETKEYVRVINGSCGITKDGTRELLKSYKYKK